jgi:hypothetical protein
MNLLPIRECLALMRSMRTVRLHKCFLPSSAAGGTPVWVIRNGQVFPDIDTLVQRMGCGAVDAEVGRQFVHLRR